MKKKICIIVSDYYPKISNDLINGVLKCFNKHGIKNYKKIFAPGVFEIPVLIAKNINKFDGFVALGCVIKGETPHFDYISRSTIDGLMQISIKYKKPVGNGILTCLNKKQALRRSNPKSKDKGGEAAEAVFSVLKN